MPDKLVEWKDAVMQAAGFGAIGVLIGLGQLLASKEKLNARIVWGRCLSTMGLSMASGAALLAFDNVTPIAQIGIAAALASLGTSGLERLIQRIFGHKGD